MTTPDSPLALDIRGVTKAYGRFPALKDVSLQAREREFLALLGPSGSGKTTLLRILAGLERPDAGKVSFGGEDFLALPVRERRVGMVFQHYALFRHMTVAQNIAFGLSVRPRAMRPPRREIATRVEELLSLVQMDTLGGRFPAQLSGGQRQRVALARALAIEPRMLLLDEPFGALDAQVRRDLRRWLRALHERTGVTTVFVTHDQEEALDLADRVAILKDGALVQLGAPNEIYDAPANPFVFDFLGQTCRLPGVVRGQRLDIVGWETEAPPGAADGPCEVLFRPDEVAVLPISEAGVVARVRSVSRRGLEVRIDCLVGDLVLELQAHGPSLPDVVALDAEVRLQPLRPRIYAKGRATS